MVMPREGYPPGVPCWVDTLQPDPEAAARFYSELFGWQFTDRMRPDAPGHYFVAQLDGLDVAGVGSQPDPPPPTPVWNTYIWVDSADEAVAKVGGAGGAILTDPFDIPGAARMAVVADPSGATFSLWQAKGHNGAQLVNAPGSWNFSDLNTRDVEGAKAFYGAVFGWEAGLADEFGMWRLPGYGDFLEQRDPDVRRRQVEVGAPEGFEDVVASLMPMTSEQLPDDVPAHWAVTFAVDDADGTARDTERLGGNVLVPPFDTGWTRTTVLRDPQGAVLTASKFTPPD
jgi:predicted enzyme related to lactoylglutathione lyase